MKFECKEKYFLELVTQQVEAREVCRNSDSLSKAIPIRAA